MAQHRYSEQFKRDTVRLVTEEGYNSNQAGKSVGVCPSTVRAWIRQYASEAPAQVTYASESDELAQLRAENRRLRGQTGRRPLTRRVVSAARRPRASINRLLRRR